MNKFFVTDFVSENIHETPEGYLVCTSVPLARTGNYRYTIADNLIDKDSNPLPADQNGVIMVYKDASVLFDPATIASFEGKPVTIGHVVTVSTDNWREVTVGIAQNVRKGIGDKSENLVADLLITDKDAIDLVKSGILREISLSYDAVYISDGAGKAHQASITGNHIAIVPLGRAGHGCRIYDSKNGSKQKMSLKETLKKAFCQTLDETFDETENKGDNGGIQKASPQVNTDQETKDAPMPNPQAQNVDRMSAIEMKLDKLLEVLTNMATNQTFDKQTCDKDGEQSQNNTDEQMVNIDPDKPIMVE